MSREAANVSLLPKSWAAFLRRRMLFHRVGGGWSRILLGEPARAEVRLLKLPCPHVPRPEKQVAGAGCRVIVDNCCHLLPANCDLVYAGGEEKSYFAANEDVQG